MKIPFSWLKDYVEIDCTPEALAEKLFSCGFEVEELISLGEKIDRVVVGQVKSLEKHPDSDHMQICVVDAGEYGHDLQIVTGAPNVYVGMKTPVALDGSTVVETNPAVLEKDASGIKKIKKGKLRGVESCGMLCSGEELGINDDFFVGASVNGLLDLGKDAPVGEDVKKIVGLDDTVFDIAVTANRPDCQSVLGMAREVSAILNKPLKMPDLTYTEREETLVKATVEVQDSELCSRYIGHYVRNVKNGKTPVWMTRRLALLGIRSISPIVDITNFVLLEIGQPMHAFDADTVGKTDIRINVRRAKDQEKITTLDDKEFTLKKDNLLICSYDKPVALAGVMGGKNSEIKDCTKNVFFEAAKFARDNIRKTSRALGQNSDSSARFEKGLDVYTTELGMQRALHLIEELHCGEVTNVKADVLSETTTPRKIVASVKKINGLLGIEVENDVILGVLERLGFAPKLDGDELTVIVPLYRDDVEAYPDLAEEIIRSYGYEHLTPTFLEKATVTGGGLSAKQKTENLVKNVLVEQGYYETYNYSFYSPKDFDMMLLKEDADERKAVKLINPIVEDLSVMRTFLAPSMLWTAVKNLRRGNDVGKEFEIANVYHPQELPCVRQPIEKKRLALAVWGNEYDFYDLKGGIESVLDVLHIGCKLERSTRTYLHPGVSAELSHDGKNVGYFGELNPKIALSLGLDKKVYLGELYLDELNETADTNIHYTNLSKYPSVERDLSVLVDEKYTWDDVKEVITHSVKQLTNVELFDVYRGGQVPAGKKSMAFKLTFTPPASAESGYTGEDADGFVRKILGNMKFKLGVELR